MAEPVDNNTQFVVDWFRVKATDDSTPRQAAGRLQAIDTLNRFIGGTPLLFSQLTEELLSEWVSWMFWQRYTLSTILLYLRNLSGLYGHAMRAGLATARGAEAFAAVKARLADTPASGVEANADPRCFAKLRRLVTADLSRWHDRRLSRDMLLFAIYAGGLTLGQIASYRKDSYTGSEPAMLEIIERYSRPKNKYLFPLNQSSLTPNQQSRAVASHLATALRSADITLSAVTNSTAIELWAIAAMRCGIPAADIAGAIPFEGIANPLFAFARRSELTPETISAIRARVTSLLSSNPDNWYALQFRPRVTYPQLQERMRQAGVGFRQTFYPMEEIVRRVGRRILTQSRPIVPGLLFFKCKAADLPELFFAIGDLAWGYRITKEPRSPYAVIAPEAIATYQQTIGQFSPDTDLHPAGSIPLRPGDRLEIIGGDFCGHTATVDRPLPSTTNSGGRTVYRLRLLGDNAIEWAVDLDERLLRKK